MTKRNTSTAGFTRLTGFGFRPANRIALFRLEARWLGEHFGAACTDYMSRVKALLPLIL